MFKHIFVGLAAAATLVATANGANAQTPPPPTQPPTPTTRILAIGTIPPGASTIRRP